jgi:steroid delta-isomerase-like uncharacterized protein
MFPSTTRRTALAAAVAMPLVATTDRLFAQEATPAAGDIEAIVRAFYEPFNTGDVSVYDTVLAEDWVDVPLGMGQQPGREGFKPIIGIYRGVFPDLQITNEDILIAGDKAAVRSTIRGTHQGDLLGIPATGQPVEFMAIDIHRLENGQIVETHHIEDFLSVIFQLGATIQPGAAATPTA